MQVKTTQLLQCVHTGALRYMMINLQARRYTIIRHKKNFKPLFMKLSILESFLDKGFFSSMTPKACWKSYFWVFCTSFVRITLLLKRRKKRWVIVDSSYKIQRISKMCYFQDSVSLNDIKLQWVMKLKALHWSDSPPDTRESELGHGQCKHLSPFWGWDGGAGQSKYRALSCSHKTCRLQGSSGREPTDWLHPTLRKQLRMSPTDPPEDHDCCPSRDTLLDW